MFRFSDDSFKISVPPPEVRTLLEDYISTLPTELTVSIFRGDEDNAAMICIKGSMEQIISFHQRAVESWEQIKLFPSAPAVSNAEVLMALNEIVQAANSEEEALAEITRRTTNQEISLEMGCLLAEALAMLMREQANN